MHFSWGHIIGVDTQTSSVSSWDLDISGNIVPSYGSIRWTWSIAYIVWIDIPMGKECIDQYGKSHVQIYIDKPVSNLVGYLGRRIARSGRPTLPWGCRLSYVRTLLGTANTVCSCNTRWSGREAFNQRGRPHVASTRRSLSVTTPVRCDPVCCRFGPKVLNS